jgi:hypothetical protein
LLFNAKCRHYPHSEWNSQFLLLNDKFWRHRSSKFNEAIQRIPSLHNLSIARVMFRFGRVFLHIVCTEVFWILCFNLFSTTNFLIHIFFFILNTDLFSPLDKTCLFIALVHIYKSSHGSVSNYLLIIRKGR